MARSNPAGESHPDDLIGLAIVSGLPVLFWMMILVGVSGLMGWEISPAAIAATGLTIAAFRAAVFGMLHKAKDNALVEDHDDVIAPVLPKEGDVRNVPAPRVRARA